ncbi:MAG: hypothetical protein MI919_16645 [Holophagales bacterium]|nr:hypothetical protein [Holophagales bacterium]
MKRRRRGGRLGTFLLLAFLPATVHAQALAIDQGVRAEGLWCLPLLETPRTWVYVPSEGRLAVHEGPEGRPQLSLLRYVIPGATGEGTESLTEAEGGGVFHFLVLYETPPETVAAAQGALRRITGDDEVVLRGPVVFDGGSYHLVSSILTEAGESQRNVLATGRAPVLEGQKLALSFHLTPAQSTLLMRSLEMETPDVSVVFEMAFHGLTDAYQAQMVVDWSEVRKSEAFSAGGSVYFVGADVEVGFERLLRDGAVKLVSQGSDADTEALVARLYDKLLELMFEPIRPETVPEDQRGGLMDALGSLVSSPDGALGSRNTTGFGLSVGFQLKDYRTEGRTVLDFDHRAPAERHSFIAVNLGDVFARWGDDPRVLRTVSTGDPAFQQREVHVGLDGSLLPEFERLINSVTITLRKEHEGGQTTVDELVLDRRSFERPPSELRLIYGWSGDSDRLAWLDYQYRVRWSFEGGGEHRTEWLTADAPMVNLFTPYERRTVELLADESLLAELGTRAVVVRVEYPFFGQARKAQVVVRPGGDPPEPIELTLPLGEVDYAYQVQWLLQGGRRLETSGRDGTGVLFLDELPEGAG